MSVKPVPQSARIYVQPGEVDRRLAALGIERDLLVLAAKEGHLDRMMATANDFPGRGEYDAASRALRTLAEEGSRSAGGWHRDTYLQIPVVLNSDETIAIAVTGGDKWTGIDGEQDPTNRSIKGPNLSKASDQASLFGGPNDLGVSFWYELIHWNGELWVELSRPSLGADGRVVAWAERIIVGSLDLSDLSWVSALLNEPTGPTDVGVTRKVSS